MFGKNISFLGKKIGDKKMDKKQECEEMNYREVLEEQISTLEIMQERCLKNDDIDGAVKIGDIVLNIVQVLISHNLPPIKR